MVQQKSASDGGVTLRTGRVAEICLERPQRANALSWGMGLELRQAVEDINQDAGVRVVVLRGLGPHFSAGGDFEFIESNTRLPKEQVAARMLEFYRMYLSVLELKVPSIAVLRGSAVGAGLCLALACDFRLGSSTCSVSANFVRIGLHPGMGATCLLPEIVGKTLAAELLLTGRTLSAREALQAGMLSQLHEESDLDAAAERLSESLADKPPLALRQVVSSFRRRSYPSLARDLQREASCQAENFGGPEVLQAIEAFRKRR